MSNGSRVVDARFVGTSYLSTLNNSISPRAKKQKSEVATKFSVDVRKIEAGHSIGGGAGDDADASRLVLGASGSGSKKHDLAQTQRRAAKTLKRTQVEIGQKRKDQETSKSRKLALLKSQQERIRAENASSTMTARLKNAGAVVKRLREQDTKTKAVSRKPPVPKVSGGGTRRHVGNSLDESKGALVLPRKPPVPMVPTAKRNRGGSVGSREERQKVSLNKKVMKSAQEKRKIEEYMKKQRLQKKREDHQRMLEKEEKRRKRLSQLQELERFTSAKGTSVTSDSSSVSVPGEKRKRKAKSKNLMDWASQRQWQQYETDFLRQRGGDIVEKKDAMEQDDDYDHEEEEVGDDESTFNPTQDAFFRAKVQEAVKAFFDRVQHQSTDPETVVRVNRLKQEAEALSARLSVLKDVASSQEQQQQHQQPKQREEAEARIEVPQDIGVWKLSTNVTKKSGENGNEEGESEDEEEYSSVAEEVGSDGDDEEQPNVQILKEPVHIALPSKEEAVEILRRDAQRVAAELLKKYQDRDTFSPSSAPKSPSFAASALFSLQKPLVASSQQRGNGKVPFKKDGFGVIDLFAKQQATRLKQKLQESNESMEMGKEDVLRSHVEVKNDEDVLLEPQHHKQHEENEATYSEDDDFEEDDVDERPEETKQWDELFLEVPREDKRPVLDVAAVDDEEDEDEDDDDDELHMEPQNAGGLEEDDVEEEEQAINDEQQPEESNHRNRTETKGAETTTQKRQRLLSPGSLRRKLMAHVNLLETLSQTHLQLNELEHAQAMNLSQHETATVVQQWDEERRQASDVAKMAAMEQASKEYIQAQTEELRQHIDAQAQAQVRAAHDRETRMKEELERAKKRESGAQTSTAIIRDSGTDPKPVETREAGVAVFDDDVKPKYSRATSPLSNESTEIVEATSEEEDDYETDFTASEPQTGLSVSQKDMETSSIEEDEVDEEEEEEVEENIEEEDSQGIYSSFGEVEEDAELEDNSIQSRNTEFLNVHVRSATSSRRSESEGELNEEADDSFLQSEDFGKDAKQLLSEPISMGGSFDEEELTDGSFRKFTKELLLNYQKDVEQRRKHEQALLMMREKALREKTREQLKWLIHQKKLMAQLAKTNDANHGSLSPRSKDIKMPSPKEVEADIKNQQKKIVMVFNMNQASIESERAALNERYYREELKIRQQKQLFRQLQKETDVLRRRQKEMKLSDFDNERNELLLAAFKAEMPSSPASSSRSSLASLKNKLGMEEEEVASPLSSPASRVQAKKQQQSEGNDDESIQESMDDVSGEEEEEVEEEDQESDAQSVEESQSYAATIKSKADTVASISASYDQSYDDDFEEDEVVNETISSPKPEEETEIEQEQEEQQDSLASPGKLLDAEKSIELHVEKIKQLKSVLGKKKAELGKLRKRKERKELEKEIVRVDEEINELKNDLMQLSVDAVSAGVRAAATQAIAAGEDDDDDEYEDSFVDESLSKVHDAVPLNDDDWKNDDITAQDEENEDVIDESVIALESDQEESTNEEEDSEIVGMISSVAYDSFASESEPEEDVAQGKEEEEQQQQIYAQKKLEKTEIADNIAAMLLPELLQQCMSPKEVISEVTSEDTGSTTTAATDDEHVRIHVRVQKEKEDEEESKDQQQELPEVESEEEGEFEIPDVRVGAGAVDEEAYGFFDWSEYTRDYVDKLFAIVEEEHGGVEFIKEWKESALFGQDDTMLSDVFDVDLYLNLERRNSNPEFLQINNKMLFDLVNISLREVLMGFSKSIVYSNDQQGTIPMLVREPFRQGFRGKAPVPPLATLKELVVNRVLRWDAIERGPNVVPILTGEKQADYIAQSTEWNMDAYERLDRVIGTELHEREREWVHHDMEEWEVIFQVSDMILDDLMMDTVRSLENIQTF